MDKQIEEMAKDLQEAWMAWSLIANMKNAYQFVAELLAKKWQPKITEGAVVIPKEVSCYDNVEERIRTFKLDGNKVDFTDEQIMAITSIFHYKEMQAEEIRKETAEKFAERLKEKSYRMFSNGGNFEFTIDTRSIDEICKEIIGE